jgi:methylase of polypeptide subunit release factors
MKEFLIENKKIYFEDRLDGGGSRFGIDSIKHDLIFPFINKGKILEMCSGPGFIGFYLNFIGLADELFLIDINDENRDCINKTINYNELTNTKFIHSDVFDSFDEDVVFDTIVSNPPWYSKPSSTFDYVDNEFLKAIDTDWNFHRKFFQSVEKYINENTKIIFIENHHGMSLNELKNLLNGTNLKIEKAVSTNGGVPTDIHSFYTVIITLKNGSDEEIKKFI